MSPHTKVADNNCTIVNGYITHTKYFNTSVLMCTLFNIGTKTDIKLESFNFHIRLFER